METVLKDIFVRFGDTKTIFFRVRDQVWDDVRQLWLPGGYRNLTGYVFTSQIRIQKDDPAPLLSFGVTLGNQALPEEVGAVTLTLTPIQTGGLARTLTTGYWDVQAVDPDGDVYTYAEGAVTFLKDVTR